MLRERLETSLTHFLKGKWPYKEINRRNWTKHSISRYIYFAGCKIFSGVKKLQDHLLRQPWFLFPSDIYVVRAWLLQLCLTLCDPIDCSPPGSSVHGILQAKTLEWVAISSSVRSEVKMKSESESRSVMSNCLPPHWIIRSVEFSRPEFQSG